MWRPQLEVYGGGHASRHSSYFQTLGHGDMRGKNVYRSDACEGWKFDKGASICDVQIKVKGVVGKGDKLGEVA